MIPIISQLYKEFYFFQNSNLVFRILVLCISQCLMYFLQPIMKNNLVTNNIGTT
jgi:hypothetical protein